MAIKKYKSDAILPGYTYTDAEQEKAILDEVTRLLKGTQFEKFIVKSTFTHKNGEVHTEYVKHKGTIEDLDTINLGQLKAFMIELFGTLDLLESHGILHLDIKPDNLLVNKTKNAKLPSKITIGKKIITLPKEKYYIKIIDWGLSVNIKKKLFLENFTYKNDLPCLSPLYDFISFLNKINPICTKDARDFITRLIRAIFHQDKSPKFKDGQDCLKTINSKHLQHFKFKDIFTVEDARGKLF